MEQFICTTCGTQYAPAGSPPEGCPICLDERQYVGYGGQRWTTLAQMKAEGRTNLVETMEPGLTSIRTTPAFAIGQHALLIQSPHGNILWDCISYLDDETARKVEELGGIRAIAISHPHYYSSMTTWADRFGAAIFLSAADREHVMADPSGIQFWEGDTLELAPGLTVHRVGGHFTGSSVLHWEAGGEGRGALLTGDTVQVVQDRNQVSFMYSYPNFIPLPAREVARIRDRLLPLRFDRIYGAWIDKVVREDAHAKLERSAARYIAALA